MPNRHVCKKLYGHHKVGGHPGSRKLSPPFRRLICRANIVRCQKMEAGGSEAACVRSETIRRNGMLGCVYYITCSRVAIIVLCGELWYMFRPLVSPCLLRAPATPGGIARVSVQSFLPRRGMSCFKRNDTKKDKTRECVSNAHPI